MARKCKYGRRSDGRCRRKPKSRGLGSPAAQHVKKVSMYATSAVTAAQNAARYASTRCSTAIIRLTHASEAYGRAMENLMAAAESGGRLTNEHYDAVHRAKKAIARARTKTRDHCK